MAEVFPLDSAVKNPEDVMFNPLNRKLTAKSLKPATESDDGADADSESQVKSVEQKFSVEQDGDGGNAVFPGKAQENDIK